MQRFNIVNMPKGENTWQEASMKLQKSMDVYVLPGIGALTQCHIFLCWPWLSLSWHSSCSRGHYSLHKYSHQTEGMSYLSLWKGAEYVSFDHFWVIHHILVLSPPLKIWQPVLPQQMSRVIFICIISICQQVWRKLSRLQISTKIRRNTSSNIHSILR